MTAACEEAFARSWADSIAAGSDVTLGGAGLADYLRVLTSRLVHAARAPELDPAVPRAVGADLVAARVVNPEALSETLRLIAARLPELLDDAAPDLTNRVAALCGHLAAGYAAALRDLAVHEHEADRQAGMRARERAEQALAASEARFRATFTRAAIGIGIADLDGTIQEANPALQEMLRYSEDSLRRMTIGALMHPEDVADVWAAYDEIVHGERDHVRVEKRFFRSDGEEIWAHLTVSLVRDEFGAPAYQVLLLEDVSERHRLQDRLEYQAHHDRLTGLPNRTLVTDRLARIFAEPVGSGRVGLCYLDLDGFTVVNDSLGHELGDELLVAVGRRLGCFRRPGRMVGRMGSDEFVIVVEDSSGEDEMVTLANDVLTAFAVPFTLGDHQVTLSASIGLVERPVSATTPTELVRAADITLHWAKADGKSRYAWFDHHRNERAVAQFTLSATLSAALDRDEFVLDYQPLVSLRDEVPRGVEALVRWRHPHYGLLDPEHFIPMAEESGSIVALGRWVLSTACRQARRWRDCLGANAPFVSVNISPRQLREPGVVADVRSVLSATGLDPTSLQLELTEQTLLGEDAGPVRALATLSAMGVRIAIDDFGTGYSNLPYLRRFPVQVVKLAASFADGLRHPEPDPADVRIVATLVDLAHALGITVTAEGVETPAQRDRLRELGCDSAQGWLFGRPVPADQIDTLLGAGTSSELCGGTS